MNGRMRRVTSARSTQSNGERGQRVMVGLSIKSVRSLHKSKRIPTVVVTLSLHGIQPTWIQWRCLHVTLCFNSTWQMELYPASFTKEVRTFFLDSHST